MSKPRILAFAGSSRSDSFNKRMVQIAATGAESAGADVTFLDLKNYPLPLYDGDLEDAHGLPENAEKLKQLFKEHDGLLIASPEYNSSISGLLKNTIDWVSRPVQGEPALAPFNEKVAVIMAASPGALGGLRGLVHLRAILGNINVTVLPQQFALAKAADAFGEGATIKDEQVAQTVRKLGARLAEFLSKLLQP